MTIMWHQRKLIVKFDRRNTMLEAAPPPIPIRYAGPPICHQKHTHSTLATRRLDLSKPGAAGHSWCIFNRSRDSSMKYLNNKHANLRIFLVQVSVVNLPKNIAQKSWAFFNQTRCQRSLLWQQVIHVYMSRKLKQHTEINKMLVIQKSCNSISRLTRPTASSPRSISKPKTGWQFFPQNPDFERNIYLVMSNRIGILNS